MPKRHYLLIILLMPVLLWAQKSDCKKDGKKPVDSSVVKDGAYTISGIQDPLLEKLLGP